MNLENINEEMKKKFKKFEMEYKINVDPKKGEDNFNYMNFVCTNSEKEILYIINESDNITINSLIKIIKNLNRFEPNKRYAIMKIQEILDSL
jgi:hypothetical protein